MEEGFQERRRTELQALYGGRRVRYILSVANKTREFPDAFYPVRPRVAGAPASSVSPCPAQRRLFSRSARGALNRAER